MLDLANYVGVAVRSLRDEAGISQEEAAHLAAVDRTYWSGVERGTRNPSVKTLQRFTDAFGIGLDDLFLRARKLAESDKRRR